MTCLHLVKVVRMIRKQELGTLQLTSYFLLGTTTELQNKYD